MSKTKKLTLASVFCALAFIIEIIFHFKISFLTLDFKDAFITVAAMILGPVYSIIISLIISLIEMVTISETGFYGMIMNFISSAAFSYIASIIYKHKRSMSGAIIALASGSVAMTVVMLAFNLIITPLYLGWTVSEVSKLIPKLLLPFNVIKALFNSAVVLLIYKPITSAVKRIKIGNRIGLGDREDVNYRPNVVTIITFTVALLLITLCLFVIFKYLGGFGEWFADIKKLLQ